MGDIAFAEVVSAINELKEDASVPKNIKAKLDSMIKLLEGECECSIKIDKALNEFENMTEEINMESFIRMQIFNVVSLLETIK